MLWLAGIIGMMAVSTAAMFGFEEEPDDDNFDVAPPGEDDGEANETDGPSVLDIATSEDTPPPEEDLAPATPALDDTTPDRQGDDYAVFTGTAAPDDLNGSVSNDFLDGLDGDDSISADSGDDVIHGNQGDDGIFGGDGDDTAHGDAGDDTVSGGGGNDDIFGHEGDDVLDGGAGADSLLGGEGDDTLGGGQGDDALHGYLGNDSLNGDAGHDTLFGGHGDDMVSGLTPEGTDPGDDQDFLNGGPGADSITLGQGDIATGGGDDDTFILGDWLNAEHQSEIIDFSPSEDSLIVFYDDAVGPPPDATVEQDADDESLHRLLLDGQVVSQIQSDGPLTLDHVTLLPQSMA